MALQHARPGEAIDLAPLGERLRRSATHAILKTQALELMRLVLLAGNALPPHSVYGEITILCIEGTVVVDAGGGSCRLAAGQLVLLPAKVEHSVRALQDASLLVTVQLPPGLPGSASSTG